MFPITACPTRTGALTALSSSHSPSGLLLSSTLLGAAHPPWPSAAAAAAAAASSSSSRQILAASSPQRPRQQHSARPSSSWAAAAAAHAQGYPPNKTSSRSRSPNAIPQQQQSPKKNPPAPIPPQLFYKQHRKRKEGKMNFGSHNVVIPGLTLLNSSSASTHLPPVAPLATHDTAGTTHGQGAPATSTIATRAAAATTPGTAASQTITTTSTTSNPHITQGGKKRQAALRRQAAASHSSSESSSPYQNPSKSSPSKKPPPPRQEDRQTPSLESGGVPDPHPLYLAQSLAPPLRIPSPRRLLVIMDLNGTLLYRPNKRNPFAFIQRPHARAFLDYCLATFHVAVWSSARPENVSKMLAQLLSPAQRQRLVVTWARDRFGLSPADYDSRVQCYKRLSALWADPHVAASHPQAALGLRWDQTNTVLVDDSVEKARSEPHNLLEIPEFAGLKHEKVDDVLPQVHEYLNECCYQADVSRFIRQNPFKLDLHRGAQY